MGDQASTSQQASTVPVNGHGEPTIQELMEVIESLHERLNLQGAVASNQTEKKLPDPERYDGGSRAGYPAFGVNLKAQGRSG